jgi:hypothetical protein
MWLHGSPDKDIVSAHLATDVKRGFIGDQFFCETNFLYLQLHLLAKIQAFSLCLLMKGPSPISSCTV